MRQQYNHRRRTTKGAKWRASMFSLWQVVTDLNLPTYQQIMRKPFTAHTAKSELHLFTTLYYNFVENNVIKPTLLPKFLGYKKKNQENWFWYLYVLCFILGNNWRELVYCSKTLAASLHLPTVLRIQVCRPQMKLFIYHQVKRISRKACLVYVFTSSNSQNPHLLYSR